MAVALQRLCRRFGGCEPEAATYIVFYKRGNIGVSSDCARELAYGHSSARRGEAFEVALNFRVPDRELKPKRGRLGMHAMCASHHEGMLVAARLCGAAIA